MVKNSSTFAKSWSITDYDLAKVCLTSGKGLAKFEDKFCQIYNKNVIFKIILVSEN